mmetsp:Transcript_65222/g.153573  ORF Transcript_65222/g.153573 Transcript_65222/m.153573 type:complete len:457 (-) Transcript_65222:50-1420(-)
MEQLTSSSWFWRFSDVYDMLWKMVIRPPRDLYAPEELGPDKFRLGKRVYARMDLELTSSRGKLQCSHFLPAKGTEARPCVVYLHGNCSSRLEAFDALPVLLPLDVTVFSLDLSGSGRSDGEYISLGYHEEQDLQTALEHLRQQPDVTSIGLWGRSMGASTSILRAAEDSRIAACVLDSAFKDLKTVAEELVGKGRFPLPSFLTGWAFDMVRSEVSTRAGFDILELSPITRAPKAACPGFFGVASDDSFVLPHHTQALHDAWGGDKHFRVFDGGHNGVRPMWFLEEAADFLATELRDWSRAVKQLQHDMGQPPPACSRPSGPMDTSWIEPGDDLPEATLGSALPQPPDEPAKVKDVHKEDFLPSLPTEAIHSVECGPPQGFRAAGLPPRVEELPSEEPGGQHGAERGQPENIPKGLTIMEQLTYLGFDMGPAEWASRRSLTLEDAVSLLSGQASVQL